MNLKWTTITLVVCAALAAWFSAAMTPGWRPPTNDERPASALDARGSALSAEITRLHERLKPEVAPVERSRNLFVFHPQNPRLARAVETAPAASVTPQAAAAPSVALTLIGMADEGDASTSRTAVISGGGQVFLVREHDSFVAAGQTFRVSSIEPSAVEVIADGTEAPLRLALR